MELHEFVHEGEANSAAFVSAAAGIGYVMEALNERWDGLGGNYHRHIADAQLRRSFHAIESDRNIALKGELEGVAEQIQNNLHPHVAVNIHRHADIPEIDEQAQSGPVHGGTKDAGKLTGESHEIRSLID